MQRLNRLSALQVKGGLKPGRHADGGNLYLNVSPSGAKSWVFLYRWEGKPKEMGLGSLTALPLSKARELAAQARQNIAEGNNPLDIKRARKAAAGTKLTFGQFSDNYVKTINGREHPIPVTSQLHHALSGVQRLDETRVYTIWVRMQPYVQAANGNLHKSCHTPPQKNVGNKA